MKIITKCVIDMGSLEVIDQESYEYNGPVAHCGGGAGPTTSPGVSDPMYNIQTQAMNVAAMMRARAGQALYAIPGTRNIPGEIRDQLSDKFNRIADPSVPATYNWESQLYREPGRYGLADRYSVPTSGRPSYGYNVPTWSNSTYSLPGSYSTGNYNVGDYSTGGYNVGSYNTPTLQGPGGYDVPGAYGVGDYDVGQYDPTNAGYQLPDWYDLPGYDLADASNLQPSQDWYNNLSPQVMAGLDAPYADARSQLLEDVQSKGMIGNQRGGYSGSTAAALGKFDADRAQQVGLQAWQMTQPGLQTAYGSEQDRNKALYQDEISRQQGLVNAQLGRNIWGADASVESGRSAWEANIAKQASQLQMGTDAQRAAWEGQLGQNQNAWQAGTETQRAQWEADVAQRQNLWQAGNEQARSAWEADINKKNTVFQANIDRDRSAWQEAVTQGKTEYAAELEKKISDAQTSLDQNKTRAQWMLDQNITGEQYQQSDYDWSRQANLDQNMWRAQEQQRAMEAQWMSQTQRRDALIGYASQDIMQNQARQWENQLLQNQLAQRGYMSDFQYAVGREDVAHEIGAREWAAELEAVRAPFQFLPSYVGGSSAVPNQISATHSPMGNAIGGGLTGALAGANMGSYFGGNGSQYGMGIGGLLGAAGGYFS